MSEKPQSFIILITKGILRDREMRRNVLFGIVMADLALLGAGSTLLDEWLGAHPLLFLLYWGTCLWLTLTAMLLALYDLLLVRAEARRERQRLKARILKPNEDEDRPS